MHHTESYQTAGCPASEPDDLNERIITAIAGGVLDLLTDMDGVILSRLEVDSPGLVDAAQLKISMPDALRWLAEQMDREMATRLAKSVEQSRVAWESKGRMPR